MEKSKRKKVEEIQEGIQVDKERDRGRKRNQRIKKGQRREIEDSKKVSRRQTKKERDSRRKRK